MLKPVLETDPAKLRAFLQPRYDDYMAARRLRMGIILPGVNLESMGVTMADREAAYAELAARYPKKSRQLIIGVAREAIFDQCCLADHLSVCRGFAEAIPEDIPAVMAVASGLGRNAVIYSLVDRTGITVSSVRPSHPKEAPVELLEQANAGVVINMDTGMGNIDFHTPELAGIRRLAS